MCSKWSRSSGLAFHSMLYLSLPDLIAFPGMPDAGLMCRMLRQPCYCLDRLEGQYEGQEGFRFAVPNPESSLCSFASTAHFTSLWRAPPVGNHHF
ncbi:uncharacterized protein AAGF69_001010 isoform 2-T2 [Amazona ochrocephala]